MPNFPKTKGLDPTVWTDAKATQIDASIASRSSHVPGDILTNPANKLDGLNLDAQVSGRATPADILVNPVNKLDGSLLDVSIGSRSSHAPADILVDPATDKLDGSLLDASIVTRSSHAPADILKDAAKKVDGERVDQILAGIAPIEGLCSPTVLDTPELVVQQELGVLFYLEGHIDMSALEAGPPKDTIIVDELISIVTPVDYKQYADSEYVGAQTYPLVYVETKPGRYGVKIELTQTLGTLRTFPYQFFVRRVV